MNIEELSCYLADVFADGYSIHIELDEVNSDNVIITVDQGNDLHVYNTVPKYIAKRALQEVFDLLGDE